VPETATGDGVGKRLSGLDGVRAIAVLMVLLGHAAGLPQFPVVIRNLLVLDIARFGVAIFFVLSGFLITTLLIDERNRRGRVSLRDFYLRRTIRIFPAAYLYIACAVVVASIGWATLKPGDVLHALTYTMDYHHDRGWALGHLWSLAVEEQFYLLWPLLFLWSGKRAAVVVGVIIALAPLVRVVAWMEWPQARIGIDEEFQYVADSLATGCLAALLVHRFGKERLADAIPAAAYPLAALVAVMAASFSEWPSFYLPVGATLVNIAIAVCLLGVVFRVNPGIDRVLNSQVAVFIGTISYSLYLWQQIFLGRNVPLAREMLPLAIVLPFLAACASYFAVERPLIRLRERFRH
jgi:Predicted acyltransferases